MTTQLAPPAAPAAPRHEGGAVPAFGGSSLLTQIRVLTGRSLRAMVTDPGIVLFGLIQPVVILFVLTQVFSRMGMPPHFPGGVSYLDYVLPAVLVDNAAQSAMQSGVGLVEDQKTAWWPGCGPCRCTRGRCWPPAAWSAWCAAPCRSSSSWRWR
ncbi:hypothetical protein [Streptomyces sp. BRB081]|uniref:hypothetical protein n=1 Tax=Streptomyces sp. BRB081 TaxID=2769544 RepID=UPI001F5CFD7B|nr:hypothetical protein [Streptomyces sp. BRB081]